MEELLRNKLKAATKLKKLTLDINELSLKTDYDKVNSLIEERQQFIDGINVLNDKIIEEKNNKNYMESENTKKLNKEIQEIFAEIYATDNTIRRNINNELKTVNEKLNQPEAKAKSVNIKI